MKHYWKRFSFGTFSLLSIIGLSNIDWRTFSPYSLDQINSSVDTAIAPTFGTRHFIIGQSPQEQKEYLADHQNQVSLDEQTFDSGDSLVQIYFSPEDNVRDKIHRLIENESKRIAVAMFAFSDKKVAQALCDAHKAGVRVEVLVDPVSLKDRYNKVGMLCDAGVLVYVYNAQQVPSGLVGAMHNKFMLFESQRGRGNTVCTGSCNATKSAYETNQENLVVMTSARLFKMFDEQFTRLKKLSYQYRK